ncbi:MAG: acetylxylan esterase, partial [Spirochaetes bacterium]|nr:acetylxylan esterase [Spirochaetota bacterium]
MASFTHAHPFDPTYGYSPQALLAIQPPPVEPPDFDAFWEASFLAARRHPIRLKREALVSAREAFRVERWDWEVPAASAFSSGAQEETYRVGAWLTLPADGEVHALLVVGHGYGGREAPDFAYPRAAALHVCMPGFNLSAGPGIPAQSDAHVVHGIESRES